MPLNFKITIFIFYCIATMENLENFIKTIKPSYTKKGLIKRFFFENVWSKIKKIAFGTGDELFTVRCDIDIENQPSDWWHGINDNDSFWERLQYWKVVVSDYEKTNLPCIEWETIAKIKIKDKKALKRLSKQIEDKNFCPMMTNVRFMDNWDIVWSDSFFLERDHNAIEIMLEPTKDRQAFKNNDANCFWLVSAKYLRKDDVDYIEFREYWVVIYYSNWVKMEAVDNWCNINVPKYERLFDISESLDFKRPTRKEKGDYAGIKFKAGWYTRFIWVGSQKIELEDIDEWDLWKRFLKETLSTWKQLSKFWKEDGLKIVRLCDTNTTPYLYKKDGDREITIRLIVENE